LPPGTPWFPQLFLRVHSSVAFKGNLRLYTLEFERTRLAALEERLAVLTHQCATLGRETERAGIQVKAAEAMVGRRRLTPG